MIPQMVKAGYPRVFATNVTICGSVQALLALRPVPGDLFMLAAVIGWAFYSWLLARPPAHMQGDQRPDWNWAGFLLVQTLFGIGAAGLFAGGEQALGATPIQWSGGVVAALLYLSLGASVVAYRCWGLGVAEGGPALAAFFNNLTPLFAALLSALMLGEVPQGYHAVAFGGTLGFTSQRWHGTRFKLSGGYTFDLETSDLTVLDPITDAANRYEIGLYDVNDPRHTNDLAYLHEFQLDWLSRNERTQVVIGKQELNTPFLNPQDGRMHPSLFEGIWAQHRTQHGTALQGGWIYRVAPRGASEWYAVDESMSVFPVGRNVYGEGAEHGEHLQSAGILAASIKQKVYRSVSITRKV